MGWDGGSHIMDAVVSSIDDIMERLLERISEGGENAPDVLIYERDDMMRPLVTKLASLLEDRGWDSQEEAEHFTRFPQEMLGYDDAPFAEFLRHKVTEATQDGTPEEILLAAQLLKNHTDKTKAGNP